MERTVTRSFVMTEHGQMRLAEIITEDYTTSYRFVEDETINIESCPFGHIEDMDDGELETTKLIREVLELTAK
jgi:hypothetical protein